MTRSALPLTLVLLFSTGCTGGGNTEPPPVDAGPSGLCVADADCDDGTFCSGERRCDPEDPAADERGCVPDPVPLCREGQSCDEATRSCVTDCSVTRDADGDGIEAVECRGSDCDDADPNRFPGNPEVCDVEGHDEDCDPSTFGYRDQDGDGKADAMCCNTREDGSHHCGDDCNDTNPTVAPGEAEVCDLLDNDCDDTVDEGATRTFYPDSDGDGFGAGAGMTMMACAPPDGYVENDTDCNDDNAAQNGGAPEVCDEVDNDCDDTVDEGTTRRVYPDFDGDTFGDASAEAMVVCEIPEGYVDNARDCDDANAARNGAAPEVCDGFDNDCDGTADEGVGARYFPDVDGDGFGDGSVAPTFACAQPDGFVLNSGDCDDDSRQVSPAGVEVCDGLDNDCSGTADEGLLVHLYPDADRDGFGDMSAAATLACPMEGYVRNSTDCDDGRANVNPALPEICDGLDNNCSGAVDEGLRVMLYPDLDGDGDGDESAAGASLCPGPRLSATNTDCDDSDRNTYDGAGEVCDAVDNDCDTTVDEGTADVAWYVDADMDGYGDPLSVPVVSCAPVAGRSQLIDCDDDDETTYPGAPQLCDGIQNDCSKGGGGGRRVSEDADDDGHVTPATDCSAGPLPKDDCDDTRDDTYGGAPELCDGRDNDCSSGGGLDATEDADGDERTAPEVACTGGFPKDDCDDTRSEVYPGAPELCDRLDTDCSAGGGNVPEEDRDRDEHAPTGTVICSGGYPADDCDDTRPEAYAGAPELCNGFDDDCSARGGVDTTEDADGDGYAAMGGGCAGGPLPATDCDDTRNDEYLCNLSTTRVSSALSSGWWMHIAPIAGGSWNDVVLTGSGDRLNDEDGSYSNASFAYETAVAGDFDGDSDLDAVVSDSAGIVQLVIDGGAPTELWRNPGRTVHLWDAVDVDEDGRVDVLYTTAYRETETWGECEIRVLLNREAGFVSQRVAMRSGLGCSFSSVSVADVNGDGWRDVVYRGPGWVAAQDDDGTSWSALRSISGPNDGVGAGDLDGNGRAEIIRGDNGGTPSTDVVEWNGSVFVPSPYSALFAGMKADRIKVVDLDGDGDQDVVLAFDRDLYFYENLGDYTLRRWRVDGNNGSMSFAIGDLNGDGELDLLSSERYFNTGTSAYTGGVSQILFLGGGFGAAGISSCACETSSSTLTL